MPFGDFWTVVQLIRRPTMTEISCTTIRKYHLKGTEMVFLKQWKKEQAIRCCTADVCLCQSVNQSTNEQGLLEHRRTLHPRSFQREEVAPTNFECDNCAFVTSSQKHIESHACNKFAIRSVFIRRMYTKPL